MVFFFVPQGESVEAKSGGAILVISSQFCAASFARIDDEGCHVKVAATELWVAVGVRSQGLDE